MAAGLVGWVHQTMPHSMTLRPRKQTACVMKVLTKDQFRYMKIRGGFGGFYCMNSAADFATRFKKAREIAAKITHIYLDEASGHIIFADAPANYTKDKVTCERCNFRSTTVVVHPRSSTGLCKVCTLEGGEPWCQRDRIEDPCETCTALWLEHDAAEAPEPSFTADELARK